MLEDDLYVSRTGCSYWLRLLNSYDPEKQWWSRSWTTNKGNEQIQEVAAFTGKTWRKLMIGSDGKTFYEDPAEDKLTAQYGEISERRTSIEHHGG